MTLDEIIKKAVSNALPEVFPIEDATLVFGYGSPLDSLGLVGLLIEIEQQVLEHHGKEIVIASEKAISQHRSPFRTVASLREFVEAL